MGCNCLQNIILKLEENGFDNIEPPLEVLSGRLYLSFSGNIKNQKKKREIPVLLSKCPFCGKAYGKQDTIKY